MACQSLFEFVLVKKSLVPEFNSTSEFYVNQYKALTKDHVALFVFKL